MLGAFVRAAATLAVGGFAGALLSWLVGQFLPFLGPQSGLLYRSFAGIADNAVLIIILSGIVTLLARANVERRLGGG